MDIENLKLIITTLNDLGANSKEAFIWWIFIKYGATYLFGLLWTGIAIYIIKLGYRLICNISDFNKLMKATGINSFFTSRELEKACEVLKKYYH